MGRKLKPKLKNHLLKRDNRKVKKRERNEKIEYKRIQRYHDFQENF